MKSQLFIIGNGFDLAHNLPTRFSPDFKNIAMRHEPNCFWDFYQSNKDDIWSDFENLLGCPDFNSLEEIFQSYSPDIPRIEKMTVMTFFVRQNQVGTFRIHYVSLSTTQNGL